MKPDNQLALDIFLLFNEHRGALSCVSGLLKRNDSTRLSRQLNPNDDRRDNPFVEVDQILTALLSFKPELEKAVWNCIEQRRLHRLRKSPPQTTELMELIGRIFPELRDVVEKHGVGAPLPDLEKEVYELLKAVEDVYEAIKSKSQK